MQGSLPFGGLSSWMGARVLRVSSFLASARETAGKAIQLSAEHVSQQKVGILAAREAVREGPRLCQSRLCLVSTTTFIMQHVKKPTSLVPCSASRITVVGLPCSLLGVYVMLLVQFP